MIGIGLLIEYVKDNPVQDWLERCPWGRLQAQRYPSSQLTNGSSGSVISAVAIVIFCMFAATLGRGSIEWLLEAAGVMPSPIDPGVLLANVGGLQMRMTVPQLRRFC